MPRLLDPAGGLPFEIAPLNLVTIDLLDRFLPHHMELQWDERVVLRIKRRELEFRARLQWQRAGQERGLREIGDTAAATGPRPAVRTLDRLQRSAKGGIIFGQNLVPLDAGTIRVGDTVTVLETGSSNLLETPVAITRDIF